MNIQNMSKRGSIWSGILYMGLGTVIAQVVNILVQPLLTRIVSPENLGIYTYVVSLATMVIPIATLKVDMLIVTDATDEDAQYTTDVCILLNFIVSAVFVFVIVIGSHVSENNVFNKYGRISYFAPLLVFTNGLRFLFISYNNRYQKYRLISAVAIIREIARAVIQVALGVLTGGPVGQIAGYAVSPVFGLHLQMKEYIQKFKHRRCISWETVRNVIFDKGRKQILYLVPAQFINSFSASLITVSISTLYTATTLGYYSAGARVLDIPILFITSNVSKVMFQRVSEYSEKKKPIFKLVLSVVAVLSAVSFAGFTVLYIIAPQLAEIAFGNGYAVSGTYIRCLCVMYAVRLVASSFSGLYTVFKKQKYEFLMNIIFIAVAVCAYVICKWNNWPVTTYLSIIGAGYAIGYIIFLLSYVILCLCYDRSLSEKKQ